MATWGSYLKSYVVKETSATAGEGQAEKPEEKKAESAPIKPIVPWETSQKTIVPILLDEGSKDEQPNQPGAANAGRLAKLFGYGEAVDTKSEATVAKSKMTTIMQQAQQATKSRTAPDSTQPATNALDQPGQANASRVAMLFDYTTPTKLEQKPNSNVQGVISKVTESGTSVPSASNHSSSSSVPVLFGYGAPAPSRVEKTPEKRVETETLQPEKPTDAAGHQRSQSNQSRVAKMFGYPEPSVPKSINQAYKKTASNPWAALEQAEREWTTASDRSVPKTVLPRVKEARTNISWEALEEAEREWSNTSDKPALKVAIPLKNESRANTPDLSSSQSSSSTYSSRGPYSARSSSTNSARSGFSASSSIAVQEHGLAAEEAERKRKVLEVEERAQEILKAQKEMDMELERMRIEEENMKNEAGRIDQETFEMKEYIQEMGIPGVSLFHNAVQNLKDQVSADPPKYYTPQIATRTNLVAVRGNLIGIQSPKEKPQKMQDVKNEAPLGRTTSRAKARLDRLNAEFEAERLKREEQLANDATEDASVYESVYESDGSELERSREEAEKAQRLEDERIAEEERVEKEKAERRREAERRQEEEEKARHIEEQRIAERQRLRRVREEERLRLEQEEAQRIVEEEQQLAERRKRERFDRAMKEQERRHRAEKEEREAKEEASRIENQRLAQQLREEKKRQDAQRLQSQNLARQQRPEAQRLDMERSRAKQAVAEPVASKDDEIRKAEEKIRKAFAGLAAEKEAGVPASYELPATPPKTPPKTPAANLYRADIRGGSVRNPDKSRLPLSRFAEQAPTSTVAGRGGEMGRAATTSTRGGMKEDVDNGSLIRAATTAGTPDSGNGSVRPRPAIRGGLPGGPRVGLPSGGPKGGGLPMNLRAGRI